MARLRPVLMSALLIAGCRAPGASDIPGDSEDSQPWSSVRGGDEVHATGTEPFWSAVVTDGVLHYATPDDAEGQDIAVKRFAGRGGLSYAGTLEGQDFVLAVTEGACSDGMSERRYPFTATLRLGDSLRSGCAWSSGQTYTGGREAP